MQNDGDVQLSKCHVIRKMKECLRDEYIEMRLEGCATVWCARSCIPKKSVEG